MFSELTPPPSHNQIGIIVFFNICGCQNVLGQVYVVFVWYKQIFSIYWVVHTCIYCFRIVFKVQYMSRQVSPHCGNWTTFTMNIYWIFFRNRIFFSYLIYETFLIICIIRSILIHLDRVLDYLGMNWIFLPKEANTKNEKIHYLSLRRLTFLFQQSDQNIKLDCYILYQIWGSNISSCPLFLSVHVYLTF